MTSAVLDDPMPIDGYKAFMPAFEDEFDDLAELGTRPVTHEVDGAAYLTPARRGAARERAHRRRPASCSSPTSTCCFAGDLCFFGVTPLAFQGDPAEWADMLDVIVELADTIVPGHGPVGGEPEARELQAYLRACVAANGDPKAIPKGPVGHLARPRPRRDQRRTRRISSPQGRDEMPDVDAQGDGPVAALVRFGTKFSF